jgi:hypothetical protein
MESINLGMHANRRPLPDNIVVSLHEHEKLASREYIVYIVKSSLSIRKCPTHPNGLPKNSIWGAGASISEFISQS